jgi:hypothetical protein
LMAPGMEDTTKMVSSMKEEIALINGKNIFLLSDLLLY